MVILQSKNDLDTSKVRVKKPFYTSQGTAVFNITYENQPLLLQAPIGHIPYSYSLYDNNSINIDIEYQESSFDELLTSVVNRILKKVNKFDCTMTANKKLISPRKSICDSDYRLRLYNASTSQLYIFDSAQKPVSLSAIATYDKVIALFSITRIVVNKDRIMICTNLHQLQKVDVVAQAVNVDMSQCMIISTSTSTSIKEESESCDLSTYDKMTKLGIHEDAVRHKMRMDGLPENMIMMWRPGNKGTIHNGSNLVEGHLTNVPLAAPLPPPPPPPPPLMLPKSNQSSKNILKSNARASQPASAHEFLKDISSGNFKLRNVNSEQCDSKACNSNSVVPKSNTFSSMLRQMVPSSYKVPSLQDILNIRSRLKKVETK
jgi:hypothetical protein